jgi:protoporphyrinogen oxidase
MNRAIARSPLAKATPRIFRRVIAADFRYSMRGSSLNNASKPRAVVLGAGLAGLRGAQRLLDAGFEVDILERLDEPGGMSRSHERGGYVFDHGPHGFFSRDEWIVDEFKELVGGERGYRWLEKWSQIHYRGHYFNYPLRMADIGSKMSPFTLMAALFSFLWSRARLSITHRQAANAEEYLVDQFGRVLYNEFFGPYTRKVWDVPPSELDADFTRDRVPTLNLWDVMLKLFVDPTRAKLTPSGRIATHELHRFYYPVQGARALSEGYVRKVVEAGGRIHLRAMPESVDLDERVVTARVGGVTREFPFDYVLSSIPLDDLVGLVQPEPPPEIARHAGSLRYRAILLVNLCVRKEKVIGPFWIYYTDRFFNRISEYKHFSPALVPEGKTGICLEVGCNVGDELWNADDARLVEMSLPDLEKLSLVRRDEIEDFVVIREKNAYPIYDVGYKRRIGEIVDWLESTRRIATAGRQGRFLYCNQDAAIKSGFEAGEAIVQWHAAGAGESTAAQPRVALAGQGPRRQIVR